MRTKEDIDALVKHRHVVTDVEHYLAMETWTPVMAALLLCGIHAQRRDTRIPKGGIGIDGEIFVSSGNSRFHDARRILERWGEYRDEGIVESSDELPPYKYLNWCEICLIEDTLRIERDWFDLFNGVAYDDKTIKPQQIPISIASFADDLMVAAVERSRRNVPDVADLVSEPEAQAARPIKTHTVISCFGARSLNIKTYLEHALSHRVPIGLRPARAATTQGIGAFWNPVMVAEWLFRRKKAFLSELDRVFSESRDLAEWRQLWAHVSEKLKE